MRFPIAVLGLVVVAAALAVPARAEVPSLLERDAVLVPTGGACCPPTTYAARQPLREAPEKPWHVTLVGYAWMTNITGSSWEEGIETDVDIAFEDLYDKLEYSFQGVAEFEYKRWFFAVDTTFQRLEQDGPLLDGRIPSTFSLEETVIDLRLGYTVLCREIGRDQWGACCYPRHYKLDVCVGARYWNEDTELTPSSRPGAAPRGGASESESWWDPYVGLRVRWPFAKRWFLNMYGDIGGFGIDDSSDLTWQLQAFLGFNVTRWLFVGVGYRALDVDRVFGDGIQKQGTDLLYHGPAIAIGVTF